MKDRFYAVFRRIGCDDFNQFETREAAEADAITHAERQPQNTFFVMKTVAKFGVKNPEIIRTVIEDAA